MLERVPVGLRGELSRWMIEPRAGVFVGNVSALVRDKLWDKVRQNARGGAALMIHSARTEQGFRVQSFGDPSRVPVDMEGLTLVRIPASADSRQKCRRKTSDESKEVPSNHRDQ
jgi:CRISPR-associated protein Cas2